jgi:hypothetical protein
MQLVAVSAEPMDRHLIRARTARVAIDRLECDIQRAAGKAGQRLARLAP